jgi:hypothetical protein
MLGMPAWLDYRAADLLGRCKRLEWEQAFNVPAASVEFPTGLSSATLTVCGSRFETDFPTANCAGLSHPASGCSI